MHTGAARRSPPPFSHQISRHLACATMRKGVKRTPLPTAPRHAFPLNTLCACCGYDDSAQRPLQAQRERVWNRTQTEYHRRIMRAAVLVAGLAALAAAQPRCDPAVCAYPLPSSPSSHYVPRAPRPSPAPPRCPFEMWPSHRHLAPSFRRCTARTRSQSRVRCTAGTLRKCPCSHAPPGLERGRTRRASKTRAGVFVSP